MVINGIHSLCQRSEQRGFADTISAYQSIPSTIHHVYVSTLY